MAVCFYFQGDPDVVVFFSPSGVEFCLNKLQKRITSSFRVSLDLVAGYSHSPTPSAPLVDAN